MKKTFTIILALTLILSSACYGFAASSYTKSPVVQDTPVVKDIEIIPDAGEDAPEIVITKNDDGLIQFYTEDGDGPAADDCLVSLKVTPYVEKQTIENVVCKVTDGTSATGEVSAEERLVYARTNEKNGTDGFGDNNFKLWRDIIAEAAKENLTGAKDANAKIQNKDMTIVTIFDVSVWCEKPAQHDLSQHHCVHTLRLTFGDDEMSALLENYVALMHYNRAGEWDYIPSKLYEDATTHEDVIEFQIDCDNLSPFAIAAFSSESGEGVPISPQTGAIVLPDFVWAVVVCACLAGIFYIKRKIEDHR